MSNTLKFDLRFADEEDCLDIVSVVNSALIEEFSEGNTYYHRTEESKLNCDDVEKDISNQRIKVCKED